MDPKKQTVKKLDLTQEDLMRKTVELKTLEQRVRELEQSVKELVAVKKKDK